ncbi:MAG: hypothetical protein K2G94_06945 [Muribaculaceae bacterium]|nr:hypothetical protein [Muribaculaceae bacterium]MDE6462901.1 hypothetical protein [Muribaculaceae bacterium]
MMTTTTFHFDGQRLSRRLMAESALRVAAGGDPADLLGSAEADALACMAGAALARVAVDLLPYSAGFDAEALTIDILLSPGADSLLAFRLTESAIAAMLAGSDSEAADLTGAAKRVLRGRAGQLRITPY